MTTAQVGYLPVHRWVKYVLGSTHTTHVQGARINHMIFLREESHAIA
jgi:hypothetical protein